MKVHHRKHYLFVVCTIVVFILLMMSISELTKMKNYNNILDADVMNVYSDGVILESFTEPQDIMDTYNGIVGIGVIDISELGLKKTDFIEVYRLEFEKDGKEISSIKMLTPQMETEFNKQIGEDYFRKFNGKYVVMYEAGHYFEFGQKFYDNLARLIIK